MQDNCPALANPDQFDPDRDGLGQDCDPRFCYMVGGPAAGGDENDCLDPQATLTVYTPGLVAKTGQEIIPGLWANRESTAMRYRWEVVKRPSGSEATFEQPEGAVRLSTPFQYHYLEGRQPTFTPDEPGEYRIRITAELAFPDEQYPDVRHAQYETTVLAEGAPLLGGCNSAGVPIGGLVSLAAFGWLALLLAFRSRRG